MKRNQTIANCTKKIIAKLEGYDPIDLLGKISYLDFLLKTDFLVDYEQESKHVFLIRNALYFLVPFYMTHMVNVGIKHMNYEDILDVASVIFSISNDYFDENEDVRKIAYGQQEGTEQLEGIVSFGLQTIIPFFKDVFRTTYNLDLNLFSQQFLQWMSTIYLPLGNKVEAGKISVREFIDTFDELVGLDSFEFDTIEAFSFLKQNSSKIGELGEDSFNIYTPLTCLNMNNKYFLSLNGKYYCFIPHLCLSKFVRMIEKDLREDSQNLNVEISKCKKAWSECLPKMIFQKYLPQGQYYSENFFFESKSNFFENDGLYLYHGTLFIIEMKGGKSSPDSIFENDGVEQSIKEIVEKGTDQCTRVLNLLEQDGFVEVYNSSAKNKELKCRIDKKEIYNIVPIVFTIEEFEMILPGFINHQMTGRILRPILINIYDFFICCDFLENPYLIINYLFERCMITLGPNIHINDELTLLGMFCFWCPDFSNALMDYNSEKSDFEYYVNDSDFARDIELFYNNGRRYKKHFCICDSILKLFSCTTFSVSKETIDFSKLLLKNHNSIQNALMKSAENGTPQLIRMQYNNQKYGLVLSDDVTVTGRKIAYNFLKSFRIKHSEIKVFMVLRIGLNDVAVKIFHY